MSNADTQTNNRILIIDDNVKIHEDFRDILNYIGGDSGGIESLEASLFGNTAETNSLQFEVDSAYQGEQGYEMVRKAYWSGKPYTLAFVDVRMPPGWDGIKTIEHLWKVDRNLEVVICTAYSDHSWEDIAERLGGNKDNLLVLKKPFDPIEVQHIVTSTLKKREFKESSVQKQKELETLVDQRSNELASAREQCRLALEKVQRMQQLLDRK